MPKIQERPGGLYSGLKSYMNSFSSCSSLKTINDLARVGWLSTTIVEQKKESIKLKLLSQLNAYPVFISEETVNMSLGFCDKVIWPVFLYFTGNMAFDDDYWINYKKVNVAFCDAILEIIKPDDIIWIHDYHLMLLPKLIRDKVPDASIGFFLHIPFPSFEIFRAIPSRCREEILVGLLGADLIGFHIHDYKQHFLNCVLQVLGYYHDLGMIIVNDRLIKVGTYPMGIDFEGFKDAAIWPEVQEEKYKLYRLFAGRKVVLSIDRLDYTKGIINRLQGYKIFLQNNPQWVGKIVLILIVVPSPSRTKIGRYQQLKRQIDESVGRINGEIGSISWAPIVYHYNFIPFIQLIALYNISDVALVTPLRDGMNLIAKEYIAARTDGKGVLILSEMAGASKELKDAIIINPNDVKGIAIALKDALEMPIEEIIKHNQVMQTQLKHHNIVRWGDEFIQTLLLLKKNR